MAGLLKSFGKGILYVLAFPLFIVALAIYAVFGFGIFLFEAIKVLILFFTGGSLYDDLPEDKEVDKIKIERANASNAPQVEPQPIPAPQFVDNNTPINEQQENYTPIENACFNPEESQGGNDNE